MFLCFSVAITSISFSKSSRAETSIPKKIGSLNYKKARSQDGEAM